MIGKITAILFVLFIVGCFGFSRISKVDTKSYVELYAEAEKTCITDYSIFAKGNRRLVESNPTELICPLQCVASKLGLVNKGGLNKILVNWTKKLFELEQEESIFGDSFQQLRILQNRDSVEFQNPLDAVFHIIRTINDQLKEGCSAIDKATRNQQVMTCLIEIRSTFHSRLRLNQSMYIPTAESSRYLELLEGAEQKCVSSFNVAVLSIINDGKSSSITKQNICTVFCMYSELEIINENDIDQNWIEQSRKYYKYLDKQTKFETVLEVVKKTLPILSSYCSSSDTEISENDTESIEKLWLELKTLIFKRGSESEQ